MEQLLSLEYYTKELNYSFKPRTAKIKSTAVKRMFKMLQYNNGYEIGVPSASELIGKDIDFIRGYRDKQLGLSKSPSGVRL